MTPCWPFAGQQQSHLHRAFGGFGPSLDHRFPAFAEHHLVRAFGPRTFLPLPLSLQAWSPFLAGTDRIRTNTTTCPSLPPPSSGQSHQEETPPPISNNHNHHKSSIHSPIEVAESESETEDSLTGKVGPSSVDTRKNNSTVPTLYGSNGSNGQGFPSAAAAAYSQLYGYGPYGSPTDPRTAALIAAGTSSGAILYPQIYGGLGMAPPLPLPPSSLPPTTPTSPLPTVPGSNHVTNSPLLGHHPSLNHHLNHHSSSSLDASSLQPPFLHSHSSSHSDPSGRESGRSGGHGLTTGSATSPSGTGLKDPNSNSIWRPY